ncbi:MAG: adenylyl-sulfate kinase [Ruminococcus sp.]|jgi:uridine kinase|uniref:uridine kinase family protein n=1 Tax=Ruminococcus sp. TaxID=41978 RepID=UPI001B4866DB|nr:adenylyl-sulfate kinase [Ruminococcus sp.]MBP5578052.1 adenylyl-sulfate kinase [Ruminococcus sp.]
MNIEITRINQGIDSDPVRYIKSVNEDYLYKLKKIADDIAENRNEKPVILLSGPSGSGKTTTAMMIEKLLDDMGHETHTLSMDNWFCPLTEAEKALAAEGKMDLESPLRVDCELLNEQIEDICACREIELPKYNFKTSTRCGSGKMFKRNKDELVIFEGIHALNPAVITVPDSMISKIYVSVRTRISDEDILLHPSRIRLMRRMIRDKNFRKRSLRETMNMFHSVEAGENKYIMPYKYRSDYDVDTFMSYELSVYRNDLLSQLQELTDVPEVCECIKVLEKLVPIEKTDVTPDSLICEFIGNGQFKY